jgi:hypothetical protein
MMWAGLLTPPLLNDVKGIAMTKKGKRHTTFVSEYIQTLTKRPGQKIRLQKRPLEEILGDIVGLFQTSVN